MTLPELRENYGKEGLDLPDLDPDPLRQFDKWLQQAIDAKLPDPNAMTLATANAEGEVCSRTVLLKGLTNDGLTFFTNYESRKARDLAENPHAALTFFWKELERQVNIRGTVRKTDRPTSSEYFHSRPRGSQIGAWVSENQSAAIPDRAYLEAREAELCQQFPGEIPLPDFWGGYHLIPIFIEFWQGRPNRLHDRFVYRKRTDPESGWQIARLSP